MAPFLNEGVASSFVHFSSYIYIYILVPSSFSPISSLLIFRERKSWSLLRTFVAVIFVDLAAFVTILSLGRRLLRNRLLGKSSLLLSPSILHLCFSS